MYYSYFIAVNRTYVNSHVALGTHESVPQWYYRHTENDRYRCERFEAESNRLENETQKFKIRNRIFWAESTKERAALTCFRHGNVRFDSDWSRIESGLIWFRSKEIFQIRFDSVRDWKRPIRTSLDVAKVSIPIRTSVANRYTIMRQAGCPKNGTL